MLRIDRIKEKINQAIPIIHQLVVDDESHKHSGRQGTESHFKVMIVSDTFKDQSRVTRQKRINDLLKEEFSQGLHALSMKLLTLEENNALKTPYETPNCASKKK